MNELFEYVKTNILHEMPSGMLVTQNDVNFNIGFWQNKSYDNSHDIYGHLRAKWTSHTINLIILDDNASVEDLMKFVSANSFHVNGRSIYFVYCIALKSALVDNVLCDFLKIQKYPMNNYKNKVVYGDYTIFVCDFIKNLLLY